MSRRKGENKDLVEVYVDVSQEEQGHHEEFSAFSPPKISTVDLTSTSNYDPTSVDHTYD